MQVPIWPPFFEAFKAFRGRYSSLWTQNIFRFSQHLLLTCFFSESVVDCSIEERREREELGLTAATLLPSNTHNIILLKYLLLHFSPRIVCFSFSPLSLKNLRLNYVMLFLLIMCLTLLRFHHHHHQFIGNFQVERILYSRLLIGAWQQTQTSAGGKCQRRQKMGKFLTYSLTSETSLGPLLVSFSSSPIQVLQ